MTTPEATRSYYKRRRVIFKRDYNREIEEVNRLHKLSCTLENVEQLEAVRLSMQKTRINLDETYMGLLDTLDTSKEDDRKFEEELLKERDNFFLQLDRASGVCTAFRRKLEGQTKRESLNASTSAHGTSASAARLPKINVPTFNGDIRRFLDFKALFENLVHHDDDIPAVRKMHYLKESLINEASATLANISISEDGYKEAWSRVLNKYDNKRVIIHTHFTDLFGAERIRSEMNLRQLLDRIDVALRGLRACGEQTDKWSSILAYVLYVRLDSKTRVDFDNTVDNNNTYFNFKDLLKFCETRACNIEARKTEEPATTSTPTPTFTRTVDPKRTFLASRITCVVCQGQHLLIECAAFAAKSPVERVRLIQAGKLCTNCFSRNHDVQTCTSMKSCKICQQRHHHLLHIHDPANQPGLPSHPKASTNVALQAATPTRRFIVLPSAKVRFACGKVVGTIRILLDNCSQATLLSDQLVKRLKLPTQKIRNSEPIRGVGFTPLGISQTCTLTLASRINQFMMEVQADVIPGDAIPYTINDLRWNDSFREVSHFNLADTAFYSKSPSIQSVDMILGAQYVERCLLNETTKLDNLILRNTQFGWTLNGEFPAKTQEQARTSHSCCFTISSIDAQLARLFDMEEEKPQPSNQTEFCETHYLTHRSRAPNGQFVVRLPFTQSPSLLGSTRKKASAILNHCYHKAAPELRQGYEDFMTEYERLGHMSEAQPRADPDYIIPHHAVLKPDSTTTKVRVVFNASAKSDTGYALNDLLAVGPQLQPDIFEALIRFRTYPVAFTGDIAMMYRCVLIHEEDRCHQRIVWRKSPSEPLHTYELNTITYGTAPASFLAVRCLHELADECQSSNQQTASAIRSHFYMDDLMTGADSLEQAVMLRQSIHDTLARAGFHLRKYQSNSRELLDTIAPDLLLQPTSMATLGDSWDSVILGIGWNCNNDTFSIRVTPSAFIGQLHLTKRQLLSEIARVFDPLGIIAPVTIRAKLLVQQVWKEEVGWDQRISPALTAETLKYLEELHALSQFAVPRTYCPPHSKRRQLIGFCDASERAYCAAVYVKHTMVDDSNCVRLVCAKTRVAPIKAMTIPRLELQGALLLSTLMEKVQTLLGVATTDATLYCDSQVVLAWLAKPTHNWDVFVKNRVQKITGKFPKHYWHYTPSENNPADLATRGLRTMEFVKATTWINGPEFLYNDIEAEEAQRVTEPTTSQEIAQLPQASLVTMRQPRSLIDNFDNYKGMLLVLGRVIQFVRRWKAARPAMVKYTLPYSNPFVQARTAAILLLQAQAFQLEIAALRSRKSVAKGSRLNQLEPFLDDDDVLRVRGRLANADYSYAKRHPIIIPPHSHFMEMYIRYLHTTFCHANKAFIVSFILAEFWVCGGLHAMVKSVLNACVTCARYRAETYSQIMGQLPTERVTPSRPFTHVGIDFCGPFTCRCVGHRSIKHNKVYACIHVCLATRAAHIEVVSDLTSTNFLLALHRFIARRGLPISIHSDCGTNFVGARNYLNLAEKSIQTDSAAHQIRWSFNPPRSPHRGGIWEAAVKAAKTHLVKMVGEQILNFEEYVTLFARIEAILNSRPLCYRQAPSVGEFILTPSHFLIGSLPYILPEPEHSKLPLWKRYDLLRVLLQSFWKVWRCDYLNMLQRKQKWTTPSDNITVGQLVLLKGDASPGTWPSAIVQAVQPDQAGYVRKVTVRCSNGTTLERDIRSLIRLPVESST